MASGYGKFDNILLTILTGGNNQVALFLEEIFGFLYRRTDFYCDIRKDFPDKIRLERAERRVRVAFTKFVGLQSYHSGKTKNGVKCTNREKSSPADSKVDKKRIVDDGDVRKKKKKTNQLYAQWKSGQLVEITESVVYADSTCYVDSSLCTGGEEVVVDSRSDDLQSVNSRTNSFHVSDVESPKKRHDVGDTDNVVTVVLDRITSDDVADDTAKANDTGAGTVNGEKSSAVETTEDVQSTNNCTVFYNLGDVTSFVKEFESKTKSRFVQNKKDVGFNQSFWNKNSRIQWQSVCEKSVTIAHDGIPFIFLGELVFCCHRGRAKAVQRKRRERMSVDTPDKVRLSKKVDCPATIDVKKIVKFPTYKIKKNTEYFRDKLSKDLRLDLEEGKLIEVQVRYYVRMPGIDEHRNHVVGDTELHEEKLKRKLNRQRKKETYDGSTSDNLVFESGSDEQNQTTMGMLVEHLLQQQNLDGDQQVTVVVNESEFPHHLQMVEQDGSSATAFFDHLDPQMIES